MKLTLTDDEVRNALLDALAEKLSHIKQFSLDDCYFTVTTPNGEVQDIETVEFTGITD